MQTGTLVETILQIISLGLTLIVESKRNAILEKIAKFRTNYAKELSKRLEPYDDDEEDPDLFVDSAMLYSIERELLDITNLYSAAITGQNAAPKPK